MRFAAFLQVPDGAAVRRAQAADPARDLPRADRAKSRKIINFHWFFIGFSLKIVRVTGEKSRKIRGAPDRRGGGAGCRRGAVRGRRYVQCM